MINSTDFHTRLELYYSLTNDGKLIAQNHFYLTNLTSQNTAESFELSIPGDLPKNLVVRDEYGLINPKIVSLPNQGNQLIIPFNRLKPGKNNVKHFSLKFDVSQAIRENSIWNFQLPKLPEFNVNEISVQLNIPKILGESFYSDPLPSASSSTALSNNFLYNSQLLKQQNVSCILGDFQAYSYTYNKNYSNPTNQPKNISVVFPSDTIFQKVIIDDLNPSPDYFKVTNQEQWQADYLLKPQTNITVSSSGKIIYLSPASSEYSFSDPDFKIQKTTYSAIPSPDLTANFNPPSQIFGAFYQSGHLTLSNTSSVAFYNPFLAVTSPDFSVIYNPKLLPETILPGTSINLPLKFKSQIFPKTENQIVNISLNNYNQPYLITSNHFYVWYIILISFFSFSLVLLAYLTHYAWRLFFQKRKQTLIRR